METRLLVNFQIRYTSLHSYKSNKLEGSVSNEISNLKNLKVFNLFDNSITGKLPQAILKLHNLKELNLSGNKMYGHIPSEIAQMRNIEAIALSDNNFTNVDSFLASKIENDLLHSVSAVALSNE